MAWALQSDAKETLLDLCASEQSTWPVLRALGVGFWFTDAAPLKKKVEYPIFIPLRFLSLTPYCCLSS